MEQDLEAVELNSIDHASAKPFTNPKGDQGNEKRDRLEF